MRVLHLFDWYLPSTLSWVSRLLLHLQDAEIQIAAPWIVQNHFCQETFQQFRFPLQPKVKTEWQYPTTRLLYTRTQRFVPSYRYWLERQLKKKPPDIVHAHFGPTGCLYLPLAQKINRPLVVTFYGFDYEKILRQRPVFRQKYQQLFSGATRILAASTIGCSALKKMGCAAEKLSIVPPSPDLKQFPFVLRSKRPNQLKLLQVATFTAKKGHMISLDAFRRALQDCPNMHLSLVGERYDPNIVQQVKFYIRHYHLEDQVQLLGPIPHHEMAGYMAGFDVFIHPSCTTNDGDHEATPVVLLEAQATGLPVLSTRHFDLPNQVEHGETGYLVAENDAPALAGFIRQFYRMNEPDFKQFQLRARNKVETQFTVQGSAKILRKIYSDLMPQAVHT